MLVRNKEREQFVFSEVETRKLLQPLSKQEEAALAALGASAGVDQRASLARAAGPARGGRRLPG